MSTDLTPRSRRASRRSMDIGEIPNTSSPSPRSAPRRTVRREESASTTSSASSKFSEISDEEKSDRTRPVSPLTPPCDTSTPLGENTTPKAGPTTRRLGNLSQSEPKARRKCPQEEESPLKISRKRPSTRKSRLSITEISDPPAMGSYLTPGLNVTRHQRAVSAPTLPFRREQSLDVDQLSLPGRYESQTSNDDAEVGCQTDEVLPSITVNQNEENGDDGRSAAGETDVSVKSTPSPFAPYNCKKGRPKERDVIDTCTINVNILDLIKAKPEKSDKSGWVYIAESKEYGPEKLKIGKTKGAPGKRIRKLQDCRLELKDVIQKQRNPFYHFSFVEKAVHLELTNQRLKLKCILCTSKKMKESFHNEWFEVDRDKALRVVEIWRNWILIQEPFDSSGTLTPYWKWRVKQLEAFVSDVNWQAWTQPPGWHHHLFLIRAHFASTRKDIGFYTTSAVLTFVSFMGHGGKGAIWAVIFLLLL